jgi:hypothetical protein
MDEYMDIFMDVLKKPWMYVRHTNGWMDRWMGFRRMGG